MSQQALSALIWSVADLMRGDFKGLNMAASD
jgi:hypothetical protein